MSEGQAQNPSNILERANAVRTPKPKKFLDRLRDETPALTLQRYPRACSRLFSLIFFSLVTPVTAVTPKIPPRRGEPHRPRQSLVLLTLFNNK